MSISENERHETKEKSEFSHSLRTLPPFSSPNRKALLGHYEDMSLYLAGNRTCTKCLLDVCRSGACDFFQ